MANHTSILPISIIHRILELLSPQDVAFRTSPLNWLWYSASLDHLYRVIPPFSSAFRLLRVCRTMIAHPEHVARSVLEISIVSMQDASKIPMLKYIVRAALALCTRLETLYLHTDSSLMRIMLGECTFRLRTLSIIDCHHDLPTIFLSRQDTLEELVIVRGDTVPLYLPKDALPNLSSFTGIPENVVRISQGRRLKTIRILPGPTPLKLGDMLSKLDALVLSSLNEFHVIVTGAVLRHVAVIARFLPCLTNIVIRYYEQNILFGAIANKISAFVNLREFSMLSLNMQPPLTPNVLDGEYSVVTLCHKHCPTLRAVILHSVRWLLGERDCVWSPQSDGYCPDIIAIWQTNCGRKQIDIKIAEDLLCGGSEDSDGFPTGDYVGMDLDESSDYGSEISHGDTSAVQPLQIFRDENVKPLVVVGKEGETQNLSS